MFKFNYMYTLETLLLNKETFTVMFSPERSRIYSWNSSSSFKFSSFQVLLFYTIYRTDTT